MELPLTERQAELLKDLVDAWIDGYEAATESVMVDPSFTGPTEMLDQIDSIKADFRDAVEIRQQLWMLIQSDERRN